MRRTLVGFPDQDLAALDALSCVKRVSRSELIRQAVSSYLEKFKPAATPDAAFGLWNAKNIDALTYQNQLRDEW